MAQTVFFFNGNPILFLCATRVSKHLSRSNASKDRYQDLKRKPKRVFKPFEQKWLAQRLVPIPMLLFIRHQLQLSIKNTNCMYCTWLGDNAFVFLFLCHTACIVFFAKSFISIYAGNGRPCHHQYGLLHPASSATQTHWPGTKTSACTIIEYGVH